MREQKEKLTAIPARSWGIAAVTGAGAFMAMLDSTVANLALESIRSDFSSTLPVVQWVATGYLIALAVSLPAAAWLGVRHGYGRLWAWSLAGFVAASVMCALAPNPLVLIAARLLQGLAGGLMVPAGQAVVGSLVGKKQLGRIFGVLGLVIALGPAIGPAIGGFLLESASWRWLFWINVPIGVIALMAARGLVPGGSRDPERQLDWQGLVLLGTGLPLLLFGAMETGLAGVEPVAIAALIAGTVLTALFIISSRRKTSPLIDLSLLQGKTFSAATVTTGLTGANMYGGLLLLPLYLQLVLGLEPGDTGLWLLVMGLGSALVLPVAGVLTDRFGAGSVSLSGAALLLISTIPFLLSSAPASWVLMSALAARGVGMALAQMPAMTAAYTVVSKAEMGDATTLVNIVQRIAGVIGAVAVVVILLQLGNDTLQAAYRLAFAGLAGISALTLVSAYIICQQRQSLSEGK